MRDAALESSYRDERGFSLIEVLVASTVCLVGLMAVISTFDSSRRLVSAAERTEVVSQRAERAIEEAISLPYDDIGLESPAPTHNTQADHPDNRVATGGGQYEWDLDPSTYAPFVMNGVLKHTPWEDDRLRLSGTVYRYVTEYHDDGLEEDPAPPDIVEGKRVTVTVTVTDPSGAISRAVTTTTIIRDDES